MPLPELEPGLVISYSYLWRVEYEAEHDEGQKDRPCAIILALERPEDATTIVTAPPIIHSPPADPATAVESLHASRKIPTTREFHYGLLPPHFFTEVLARFLKCSNGILTTLPFSRNADARDITIFITGKAMDDWGEWRPLSHTQT